MVNSSFKGMDERHVAQGAPLEDLTFKNTG